MDEKTIVRRHNLPLLAAALLYLVAGGILIQFYRYQINPDGMAYISIAQKYISGDFKNAINGYFSPMLSWLLVPLLFFGLEPLLSAKLLNLAIGALTLGVFYSLSFTFRMRNETRIALLFAMIPVLLFFAFDQITPDLLVAYVLLFYFQSIFDPGYAESRKHGVLCGIFGAVAFFAKSFSFAFFLCHFPLMNLIHYFKNRSAGRRKGVLANFIAGMIIFTFISVPWITAIKAKYGFLTLSIASLHNLQFVGPTPPKHGGSFVAPPNETAISIWEDQYALLPLGTWSPFESATAFTRWMMFFLKNISPAVRICIGFSPLAFVLCGGYLLFQLRRPKQLLCQDEIVYPLLVSLLQATGYCLVLLEERYFWIICFLMALMSGYVLERLSQHAFVTRGRKTMLLTLLILSFAIAPLTNLRKDFNTGKDIYLLGEALKQYVIPYRRLATSGYWYRSLFLAFHLQTPIYGTGEKRVPEELFDDLEKHSIDYYLTWGEPTDIRPPLSIYRKTGHATYAHKTVTLFERMVRTE